MKKKSLKTLILAGIAAGMLVTMGNAVYADDNVIHIAYVGSGVAYPNDLLGVAIDQGYLDEELGALGWSYEGTTFAGGNLVNEALISGEADFASYGDVPALSGKSKGAPTTLLGAEVYAQDAALVVGPDSEINSIEELKGKTVGTLEGSFMHKVLITMVEDNGMTIDDIKFTNMQSADAAAVEAGTIDAALLSEVQYSIAAVNGDVKVLLSGGDKNEWRGSAALVSNSKFLEENRDVVTAVMKALVRAYDFSLNNYDETIASLAKSGMSEDALKFRFADQVEFNLRSDEELISAMETVQDFLTGAGISSTEVDLSQWLDSSVLEDAQAVLEE